MTDTRATLGAGLNPVQAQQVYRAVLAAFARPGVAVSLPATEFPAALLPVLALADLETRIHLLGGEEWVESVAVATGAPVAALEAAAYVTALRPVTAAELRAVAVGTALRPEDGATVICAVDALHGGPSALLSGPGVRESLDFAPTVGAEFWAARRELTATFPAGVDLLFVDAAGDLAGVPRTTLAEFGKAN
ncbi:phosphonate C-P lyase system protein PhnH [Nocardia wallacei]|uniref:phosphonate C-P lyase system protein PhnH n=1 Tax=Nocardia wallacei TaxID=480035 RepID=UPI002454AD73|nr:phosphonate C-P lyase system protein PhnH [Nocardia wallacei]